MYVCIVYWLDTHIHYTKNTAQKFPVFFVHSDIIHCIANGVHNPLVYDAQKKKHSQPTAPPTSDGAPPPKTFVMERGKVGSALNQLIINLRQIMEPNTATRLKVLVTVALETRLPFPIYNYC